MDLDPVIKSPATTHIASGHKKCLLAKSKAIHRHANVSTPRIGPGKLAYVANKQFQNNGVLARNAHWQVEKKIDLRI